MLQRRMKTDDAMTRLTGLKEVEVSFRPVEVVLLDTLAHSIISPHMDTAEPIAADGQVDSAQSWPSAPVFSWTSGPREVASAGVASTFTTPSNFFRSARW